MKQFFFLQLIHALHGQTSDNPPDEQVVCQSNQSCMEEYRGLLSRLSVSDEKIDGMQLAMSSVKKLREGTARGEAVGLSAREREYWCAVDKDLCRMTFDERHTPFMDADSHIRSDTIAPFNASDVLLVKTFTKKRKEKKGSGFPQSKVFLAVLSRDNMLRIVNPSTGEVLAQLLIPFTLDTDINDNLFSLAVNNMAQNDVYIAVANSHKRAVAFAVSMSALNDKFESTVNITLSDEIAFPDIMNEEIKITAVGLAHYQNSISIVAGDNLGSVSMFANNGTFVKRVQVSTKPIVQLKMAMSGGSWVLAEDMFGLFSLTKRDLSSPPCKGWSYTAASLVPEVSTSHRVFVHMTNGMTLSFSNTHGKNKECKVLYKFPGMMTSEGVVTSLNGGIVTVWDGFSSSLIAFNAKEMQNNRLYHGMDRTKAVVLRKYYHGKPKFVNVHLMSRSVDQDMKSRVVLVYDGKIDVQEFGLSASEVKEAAALVFNRGLKSNVDMEEQQEQSWLEFIVGILESFPRPLIFGTIIVIVAVWRVKKGDTSLFDMFRENTTSPLQDGDFDAEQYLKSRGIDVDALGSSQGIDPKSKFRIPTDKKYPKRGGRLGRDDSENVRIGSRPMTIDEEMQRLSRPAFMGENTEPTSSQLPTSPNSETVRRRVNAPDPDILDRATPRDKSSGS